LYDDDGEDEEAQKRAEAARERAATYFL